MCYALNAGETPPVERSLVMSVRSTWIRSRLPAGLCLAALLLLQGSLAHAQDAHYWTQQYGNQARLLGGTVIGGSNDVSTTYYNPGRLALLANTELLLAGNAFDYTTIKIDGALGGGEAFTSTRLGSVPSLFAGQIRGLSRGKSKVAYSVLTRHSSFVRLDERRDITDQIQYDSDQAAVSFSLDETMSDYWAGLTWAHALGDHVGIGVSTYLSIRSQRSRSMVVAQIARSEPDDRAGVALQRSDFNYSQWSFLAKVGIGADLGGWQLGLTATTTNLGVYSSGSIGYDETVVGQDLDDDGDMASQVITGYQDELAAEYRMAPSLGAGVSRRWEQTTFHVSAEWFAGVAEYTVLDADPVPSSDGSLVRDVDITDYRNAVFNAGLGLEHRFHDKLGGYASFRTDFSAIDNFAESRLAVGIWDIYHLSGGASFTVLNSEFTLGLTYSFGHGDTPPVTSVIPDADGSDIDEPERTLRIDFRRVTGLLGFAFGF